MLVGITYDLRDDYLAAGYGLEETAEFDRLETIEAIDATLQRLGYTTERIGHVRHLASRLVAGARWDLVFNIAEGLHGFGREAQVPALLDAYALPYTFSDPLVLSLALHKGMSKHVMRALGIPTADFLVLETLAEVERCALPLPLFVKPVAEGTGKGVSAASTVHTLQELSTVCSTLLATYGQPVLVETFLPGREFTVGIIGTGAKARTVGVMEVLLLDQAEPAAYSYANKAHYETRVRYRLVDDAAARQAQDVALRVWRSFGCRDGGRVDLRCAADGQPHFLEVNPLAGLHPMHSDLPILCTMVGMNYETLIGMIMASALERITAETPQRLAALLAQPSLALGVS